MRDWPPQVIPRYQRAVFLDRDGTINVDTHYPHEIDSLEFIPDSLAALALLAQLPLEIIIVSNQAGIAHGIFTREQMSQFNRALLSKIESAEGRIDAIYFCPDLEAKDLPQGAPLSPCSKPSPGMLLEAAKDFTLDLTSSFLIGDKTSDIAAGGSVGCRTILLKTGKAGKEEGALPIKPNHVAEDLNVAARIINSYMWRSQRNPS